MAARPFPEQLYSLARLFSSAGVRLYAVGGAVRNTLLDLPWEDVDVCSALLPEQVMELCKTHSVHFVPTAPELGTVVIVMDGMSFEHTTFRGDSYPATGQHRPEQVTFCTDVHQDALRRDFTVNAIYFDPIGGEYLDPVGGRADLEKKILRAARPQADLTMGQDALRILRLVRFGAQLGFRPEKETLEAARRHSAKLSDIAWERKRKELSLLLLADVKYGPAGSMEASPVLDGLHLLVELGAMEELIPELLKGRGMEQHVRYHRFDVMEHNLRACAAVKPELILRVAALLHDVGKPYAVEQSGIPPEAARDWRAYGAPRSPMQGHDELGAQIAEGILQRLKFSRDEIARILALIRYHMYDLKGEAKDNTLRMRFAQLGWEMSHQLCAIREADMRGSGMEPDYVARRWRDVLAWMKKNHCPFSEEELACTGNDIMSWLGIGPGPAVGEVKRRLFLHCAWDPKSNTPERLKRLAKGIKAGGDS